MKRKFLVIPALCVALAFGCDSDRRTAQSDGYQETDGLNEAEYAEGVEESVTDESLGGEGSFDVEVERTAAEGITEDTQEFLTSAASSSLLEVRLAQIALQEAQSQEVIEYAKMIENDHRKMNERLINLSQQKNFNLPETIKDEHEEKVEDLTEKTGQEFEKEYMNMQVDLHQKDIEKFQEMKGNVQDPAVSQWIDNSLSALRAHKEQAQIVLEKIQSNTNNNL